jgi:hypothetical protein
MDVLSFLAEHPGEVLPKETILQAVWPETYVSDDVLRHSVSLLRRAFRDDVRYPQIIQTISKRGYRLVAPVKAVNGAIGLGETEARDTDTAAAKYPRYSRWQPAGAFASVLLLAATSLLWTRGPDAPPGGSSSSKFDAVNQAGLSANRPALAIIGLGRAAEEIAKSAGFKDCHQGINNWDACNWRIYTGRWTAIADHWGGPTAHPQPEMLKTNPVGYWLYARKRYLQLSSSPDMLTLSNQGRTESREWTRVALPGGQVEQHPGQLEIWDVPLATKKLVAISNVIQGTRMGAQFTEVHYTWTYVLTPLGMELFKNEAIPSSGGKTTAWVTPAEVTGIDVKKIYGDKATFILHGNGWRLQEDCRGDIC